jgi:hypothetical protein
MDKGTQIEMTLDTVLDAIIAEVGTDSLSFYHPSKDFIITDVPMNDEKMKRVTLD